MVKNLLNGPPRDWAFLVRINPLGSGLTLEDLAAIVRPGLDGILIPKVNGIEDVELISHYVDVLEVANGVTPGHVKLLIVATEAGVGMPNRDSCNPGAPCSGSLELLPNLDCKVLMMSPREAGAAGVDLSPAHFAS